MNRFKRPYLLLMSVVLLVILSSLSLITIFAQENTVITIAIQDYQQSLFSDEVFEAFEEAHPGVDVVTVILSNENRYFGSPQTVEDIEEFLENANSLASKADLIPFEMYDGPRLRTRAGMYLDINPLLNADPNANIEDFYPSMLESLQWDGGTWGLPMSGGVQLVIYDKNAFDAVGLAYPEPSWTLDDFINAGMALTEFDSEGNVLVPGFFGFDPSVLFSSLIDGDLSDPNSFPSRPLLNTPEVIALVEQWAAFQAEYGPDFSSGINYDFNTLPLSVNATYILNDEFGIGPSDADFQGVLLPGNQAGLQVQAYGISAGTSHPQLAYELLQYMTLTPEIAYAFFDDSPSRQSLVGADTSDMQIFRPDVPEELQSLIDEALLNAMPSSDRHFMTYLDSASWRVNDTEDPVSADVALQEYQEDLTEVFIAIEESAANNIVEVATPVPTPILQAGEISLRFGAESNFGPADRDLWDAAIEEFVAQDSQVRQIVLDTEFYSLEERVEEQDCFYLTSNAVPSADLTQFYSLDPFLSTDTNLDPNNFINDALNQVSRDNAIWGIPMSLTPIVIWYNTDLFAEAGLPEPQNDWTIFEFVDALNALEDVSASEPYQSETFGGTYLYMLFAAYGGFPIDYSDTLYTFNLTDPTNLEAMRQVLGLAQDELIAYQELGNFGGGGGFGGGEQVLLDAFLSASDWRLQNRGEEFSSPLHVVMFPRGVDYIPLSYALNVAYISSNSPAPDACYRWLSFLSRRGELLNGMPAQIDMFEASVAQYDSADDVVAFYHAFNEALQDPRAVVIPSPFGSSSSDPIASALNFLSQNWINQAFDKVVLEDADLETALVDAQQYIDEFLACTSGIAPSDQPMAELSIEEQQDFFAQYARCAVDVDPSMAEMFGPLLEDDEE